MQACYLIAHSVRRGHVDSVVGKGEEMNPRQPGQVPQQIPRADLVATIGRPGQPVREEKDIPHQPSPRAIQGPTILATASGKRCQTAILALYLGLSGLTARGSAPSAVRTA